MSWDSKLDLTDFGTKTKLSLYVFQADTVSLGPRAKILHKGDVVEKGRTSKEALARPNYTEHSEKDPIPA